MKINHFSQWRALGFCLGFIFFCLNSPLPAQSPQETPPNFKIAFIGDQGLGPNAEAVLNLIKNEGANAVVHSGDFDYDDNPPAWENQINKILGANFPYFASIGNHDDSKFFGAGGYQEFIAARMNRLGIAWSGNLGVQSSFTYNGIFFVMTAPGITGTGHDVYVRNVLAADNSIWRISSWHKCMQLMQVGGKSDETGWGVYEEARKGGAIIATAHEHSYSRTHLLSSCQNQTVASTSNTLLLTKDDRATPADEGKSFVFVSGLGGQSIRDQQLSGNWWASIYTSTQGANYGALFGIFNFNGTPNLAKFYFKAITGVVPDSFYVTSDVATAVNLASNKPIPEEVVLQQNYPNPFNPSTTISYSVPKGMQVTVKIYNIAVQEMVTLVDGYHDSGNYTVTFDASGLPSGIYFTVLKAGAETRVRRIVFMK